MSSSLSPVRLGMELVELRLKVVGIGMELRGLRLKPVGLSPGSESL